MGLAPNLNLSKFLAPDAPNLNLSKFLAPDETKAGPSKIKWPCSDFVVTMLLEGTHADVSFTAPGGSVKAHKSVLACVSPVFCAMFQHEMKENLSSTVDILDMSIEALELFLLLLYVTNPFPDDGKEDNAADACPQSEWMLHLDAAIDKHFVEFYGAVRKYQVESRLGSVLLPALTRHLTPDNCWHFYESSLHATLTAPNIDSYSLCYEYILSHYPDVIKSESFLEEMKNNTERVYRIIVHAESQRVRDCALQSFQRRKRRRQ